MLAAAAVVLPNLAAERVGENEIAARDNLSAIRSALGEYRAATVRDTDHDGEGE